MYVVNLQIRVWQNAIIREVPTDISRTICWHLTKSLLNCWEESAYLKCRDDWRYFLVNTIWTYHKDSLQLRLLSWESLFFATTIVFLRVVGIFLLTWVCIYLRFARLTNAMWAGCVNHTGVLPNSCPVSEKASAHPCHQCPLTVTFPPLQLSSASQELPKQR